MSIPPILLSMMVCDTTIRDIQSKKISLIGCFSGFVTKEVPYIVNNFSLFICLTEGSGAVPLILRIRNLQNNDLIFKHDSVAVFSNSITPTELVFILGGIKFPEYGQYAIELGTDKEFIGSVKISVSKPQNKDSL
jgi:hypothetical protein